MVDLSALEARQTSPTLYNEDVVAVQRSRRPEEEMINNRYQFRQDHGASPLPPTMLGRKSSSRRKRRDVNKDALQELDDTVASIGSRRGDASWNDGDSVSQSSQTIATHEGHSQTHRSLIANMRDIKDMRGRSLPNPYVVGPRSVSSRRSRGSRLSRRSSSGNRKRDALERMISLTLLETATSEDAESHFLSISEDTSYASAVTTDEILNDLVTVSTIVEQETRSYRSGSPETNSSFAKNPKSLLANASGDSGEESYDNVDYDAPRTTKPIFFKLHKQAHQTIPEEDSPRHSPGSPVNRSATSPVDPFSQNWDTRQIQNSNQWSTMERQRHVSPKPYAPERRKTLDPPAALEPKQLFDPPSLADDGFPTQTEDTPIGASVASFFQSQMDAPSAFPSEWNKEWTTFETSPFVASDASPSSVVDNFKSTMIHHAASEDSGYGSKYSI